MKETFTIRPAKNHDAKKIFDFLCKMEEQLFDQQEFLVNYQVCISGINNIYLVAVGEDNEPVGFISCYGQLLLHHAGLVFEIQELFIDFGYRNRGLEKLLLEELENHLSKREYQSLEVTTRKWQMETRQFYAGHGFESTHIKLTKKQK